MAKLKDYVTNRKLQDSFLPILESADTKIKSLILVAFLSLTSVNILKLRIAAVIGSVAKKIPADLPDKEIYLSGLTKSSEVFIKEFYIKPKLSFQRAMGDIIRHTPSNVPTPEIKNPRELNQFLASKKDSDLWAVAKGTANVTNYADKLKETIKYMSENPTLVYEEGKKPISIWQKAELQTRYEGQLKMLGDLDDAGVEYAWISTHPNCSKRCEKWQGELVALRIRAKNPQKKTDKHYRYNKSSFIVGKLDGHTVYSLTDIMAVEDPWGYQNNIIVGFNCRHKLIPYKEGQKGPQEFSDKDVAKQRDIEIQIRAMEREIRQLKKELVLYKQSGEKPPKTRVLINGKFTEVKLSDLIKRKVELYKQFCERNGYAWNQYRIAI